MQEIWKAVHGYEGIYEISNFGKIKRLSTPNSNNQHKDSFIMSPGRDLRGYLIVCLYKNKKRSTKTIHRLVAIHFIPNPENKKTVNHKDGDKENNYVENLEWNTYSENNKHAFKIGLRKPSITMSGMCGKLNPQSKPVLQLDMNNNIINEFESCSLAKKILRKPGISIGDVCHGKRKTAGGFKWRFK